MLDVDAPELQSAAAPSPGTSVTVRPSDFQAIADKVNDLAASHVDVRQKLAVVSDAVSGASTKLESHGKAIESFGFAISGLKTSVITLTDVVKAHLSQRTTGETAGGDGRQALVGSPPMASADAPAVQVLRKVRRVGPGEADVKTASLHASFMDRVKAEANERVVGMHHMIAISRKLNDRLSVSLSKATTCAGVYHDADTFGELVLDCVMEHFNCGQEQANLFLKCTINQPKKQRGGAVKEGVPAITTSSSSDDAAGILGDQSKAEPIAVRAGIPLHAVQPHLIEAIKKRVIPSFFAAVDLNFRTVTLIQVLRWLAGNQYTASENGKKALREGVLAMYKYLGVTDRMQQNDVGNGLVVNLSIGHYALVSCCVRHCLEMAVMKAYNRSTRRTGVEPGLYVRWRVELLRVDQFLEKDNDARRGLAFTDGHDASRAALTTSENEMVTRLYKKHVEDDERYARLLQRLEKELDERSKQTPAETA